MNQYSLWRYILLAVLIVLGLVYAAPNFFGDDPAIQVTSKSSAALEPQLKTQIDSALEQDKIFPKSSKIDQYTMLVRFKDTEDQLKAQDIIQAVIGPNYVVALNLAPKTPRWLLSLGAKPMKLGLDLRGGIHFLLEVDVDAMRKEHQASDIHSISNQLREAKIHYITLNKGSDYGIIIQFVDTATRNQALNLLSKDRPDYQFVASKAGNNLEAKMTPEAVIKLQQYAVAQNLTTLRNRVNELGVAEPVIQQQGKNLISVDLPGIQDTARAKTMIGRVATIRLQLVDQEHDIKQAIAGEVPFGSSLYYFDGRPVLLKNQIVLHGSSILNASTIVDENGRPAVSVRAGGSDVALFNRITRENIGKPMATVYVETKPIKKMLDGKIVTQNQQEAKIINIATIQSALGNSFQITGLESEHYAQDLALQLRSGAYTAPVSFVQERLVGPSLGKANIRRGVLSTEIGTALVFIFMLFYYRLFGLFADLALLLNIVFVVAVMSIIEATLTLPGIAAIVLTVGMAVDANVLINERIREELRNGVSPQASIRAGYDRAFSTIVDANVTTLIVAVVLFALGTGPVQGFAITLTIGLLTSMITAIFFTRALVNLIYGRRRHVRHLSIGISPPASSKPRGGMQNYLRTFK